MRLGENCLSLLHDCHASSLQLRNEPSAQGGIVRCPAGFSWCKLSSTQRSPSANSSSPLSASTSPKRTRAVGLEDHDIAMTHTLGKSPVLLIEDDDDTRETMQLLLELKGFDISTASNGREGLDLLERGLEPCIILLDWMMPVMSGREFMQAVKTHPNYSKIPVLVVTAFSGQDRSIPTDHLKKPISTERLLVALSAHCATS